MRKLVYDALSNLEETKFVGQHEGTCKKNLYVIKFNDQAKGTDKGGWQDFEVLVYVPVNSIAPMEPAIESAIQALTAVNVEFTGNITPDFVDNDKKAVMRSIKFRIPKEI